MRNNYGAVTLLILHYYHRNIGIISLALSKVIALYLIHLIVGIKTTFFHDFKKLQNLFLLWPCKRATTMKKSNYREAI